MRFKIKNPVVRFFTGLVVLVLIVAVILGGIYGLGLLVQPYLPPGVGFALSGVTVTALFLVVVIVLCYLSWIAYFLGEIFF